MARGKDKTSRRSAKNKISSEESSHAVKISSEESSHAVKVPNVPTYGLYNLIHMYDQDREANSLVKSNNAIVPIIRYREAIANLRNEFEGGKIAGFPHTNGNEMKYYDLTLAHGLESRITVRIRHSDLYLYGVKRGENRCHELRKTSTPHEKLMIPDSDSTGYEGGYGDLGKARVLTFVQFRDAVINIYENSDPNRWKFSLTVIIQTVFEAVRFYRVEKHMLRHFYLKTKTTADSKWDEYLNVWGQLSKAVKEYASAGNVGEFNFNNGLIDFIGLFGIERLGKEIAIIKY